MLEFINMLMLKAALAWRRRCDVVIANSAVARRRTPPARLTILVRSGFSTNVSTFITALSCCKIIRPGTSHQPRLRMNYYLWGLMELVESWMLRMTRKRIAWIHHLPRRRDIECLLKVGAREDNRAAISETAKVHRKRVAIIVAEAGAEWKLIVRKANERRSLERL